MPGDNPYIDGRRFLLERELAVLRAADQAHAAYAAALAMARETAGWHATKAAIDDILDGLADLRADGISDPVRAIEGAIELKDMAAEQAAALSARPRVI
jgi:hypothetical protein